MTNAEESSLCRARCQNYLFYKRKRDSQRQQFRLALAYFVKKKAPDARLRVSTWRQFCLFKNESSARRKRWTAKRCSFERGEEENGSTDFLKNLPNNEEKRKKRRKRRAQRKCIRVMVFKFNRRLPLCTTRAVTEILRRHNRSKIAGFWVPFTVVCRSFGSALHRCRYCAQAACFPSYLHPGHSYVVTLVCI